MQTLLRLGILLMVAGPAIVVYGVVAKIQEAQD